MVTALRQCICLDCKCIKFLRNCGIIPLQSNKNESTNFINACPLSINTTAFHAIANIGATDLSTVSSNTVPAIS